MLIQRHLSLIKVSGGSSGQIPGGLRTMSGEEVRSRCTESEVTTTNATDWGFVRREEENSTIHKSR